MQQVTSEIIGFQGPVFFKQVDQTTFILFGWTS